MMFMDFSPYYVVGLVFIFFFILVFIFSSKRTKGKDYVRNYKLTTKIKIILIAFLIIDFYGLLQILNYKRETRISSNLEKKEKDNLEKDFNKTDYLYK